MAFYTLYNKHLEKRLTHPKIGIWYTTDLNEAKEMLDACHEYVKNFEKTDNFVVIDGDTGEEISFEEGI